MKNVFIIGMDRRSGEIISKTLKAYDNFFQLLVAENDDQAFEIITNIKPDLVIADLSRPETKPLELLHPIKKSSPDTPVIAIIDVDKPLPELKIEYPGITEYINKPIDIKSLSDIVLKILHINMSGQIRGIGLPSFLQMIEMEEKSCYLKVRQDRNTGYLYFIKGELIAAETGTKANEEAAYEIIGWDNPGIEIFASDKSQEKKIALPLMNILMESLKRKDEKNPSQTKDETVKERIPDHSRVKTSETSREIGLEIGTRLHIKLASFAATSKSLFVGMKPEEYLIVSTPRSFDAFLEIPDVGKQVVVKYLYNGIIFAFQSDILHFIPAPFDLLLLQYPKKIELRFIRSLKRVKCFIPAKAACKNEETTGSILDINIRGCGCQLQILDKPDSLSWKINDFVSLRCRFPGVEGEVEISGQIKNLRVSNEGLIIGVAFPKKMNPEIEEIITQYIVSVGEPD